MMRDAEDNLSGEQRELTLRGLQAELDDAEDDPEQEGKVLPPVVV
jgi:hypothetical protein